MTPINFEEIREQAMAMRAAEMRRLETIAAERIGLMAHLLAASLLKGLDLLSETLRPLFSWDPQPSREHAVHPHVALATRLNRAMRALFAWNPQPPRHC